MTRTATLERTKAHERQRLLERERRERERAEASAVYIGVLETVYRSERRGEVFQHPVKSRGAERPYRRLAELDQLAMPKRIRQDKVRPPVLQPEEYEAGKRYAELWFRLYGHSLRSCIDDSVRGGSYAPNEARANDLSRLDSAHEAMGHDARLINILTEVCGKDRSLNEIARNDAAQRERLKTRLIVALRIVAKHWGLAH